MAMSHYSIRVFVVQLSHGPLFKKEKHYSTIGFHFYLYSSFWQVVCTDHPLPTIDSQMIRIVIQNPNRSKKNNRYLRIVSMCFFHLFLVLSHRIHVCHIWQYMVTWIPSIYPSHLSIYTSTMDPMGIRICHVMLA